MTRIALSAALALLVAACSPSSEDASAPTAITEPETITLTGTVTRDDYPSYVERPFTVPPGVKRLTLTYDYTAKGDGVTLDLGLRDPEGQRGWSGSNKTGPALSAWEATPSFRPGPIIPGEWTVIIGVPAVREGITSDYTVTIELDNDLTIADFPATTPDSTDNMWVRGDFHTHTGHSDGSCVQNAIRMPCPTTETINAAARANLDFVAVTDHNTLSQLADLQAATPLAPGLLAIPGTEITTFEGHANVIGLLQPLDFQLGSDRLPDLNALLDEVERRGALISVNHPGLPTGERCMGCGWNAETDWSRIDAVEVVNGGLLREGAEEEEYSGIAYWHRLLDDGYRLTAIGGSDNHDPTDTTGAQSPIGAPTTVIRARSNGVRDIIDGVRSGNVFLDLSGANPRSMQFDFDNGAVQMGGELTLAAGEQAQGALLGEGVGGLELEIASYNVEVTPSSAVLPRSGIISGVELTVTAEGQPGWFRANLRDPATGRIELLGNPIYVVPN